MVRLRNVTKFYQMGLVQVRALDGVSLHIRPGEFVSITGSSGSGKSTMMHIIGCLDRPTDGQYHFDDQPVETLSDRSLARLRNRSIGFVFQTFNLINAATAVQNVALPLFYAGRTRTAQPALQALETVGLANRAHHKPSEMSGGERQRVAIARAIVNDPVLILADEPTGNLDSKTGQQIIDSFHQLNARGVTIVLVTHEPDIAAQAQRIIHMHDGKITEDRLTNHNNRSADSQQQPRPQETDP
jgi:putative ABC transport system ATP-binding protein